MSKIIIICVLLLVLIVIFNKSCSSKYEHLDTNNPISNEAIQVLSSMYNTDNMKTTNLEATNLINTNNINSINGNINELISKNITSETINTNLLNSENVNSKDIITDKLNTKTINSDTVMSNGDYIMTTTKPNHKIDFGYTKANKHGVVVKYNTNFTGAVHVLAQFAGNNNTNTSIFVKVYDVTTKDFKISAETKNSNNVDVLVYWIAIGS